MACSSEIQSISVKVSRKSGSLTIVDDGNSDGGCSFDVVESVDQSLMNELAPAMN